MKNQMVPMCWKCKHGLWAKCLGEPPEVTRFTPSIFKGCAEDSRIDFDNRVKFCPLIPAFKAFKKSLKKLKKSVDKPINLAKLHA